MGGVYAGVRGSGPVRSPRKLLWVRYRTSGELALAEPLKVRSVIIRTDSYRSVIIRMEDKCRRRDLHSVFASSWKKNEPNLRVRMHRVPVGEVHFFLLFGGTKLRYKDAPYLPS
jgi:hypothetical protein